MRARTNIAVLAGFLFVGVCYGLEVLEVREPVVDIKPYISTHDTHIKEAEGSSAGFDSRPLKSKATPGKVHSSDAPSYINTSIVILGDDDESRQWVAEHAYYLKNFHGLGLVANASVVVKFFWTHQRTF